MEHPGHFLLRCIVDSNKDKLPSLGRLHAEHFEDITQVMKSFAEETIKDVVTRINKGEEIYFGEFKISLSQLETKQ